MRISNHKVHFITLNSSVVSLIIVHESVGAQLPCFVLGRFYVWILSSAFSSRRSTFPLVDRAQVASVKSPRYFRTFNFPASLIILEINLNLYLERFAALRNFLTHVHSYNF